MEFLYKILIIFILFVILYELVYRTIILYGYNYNYSFGGVQKSLLSIDPKCFVNFKYNPINDYVITPDYHFKQMTKKWVSENDCQILMLDETFNYEEPGLTGIYTPDAVLLCGNKTIVIEFDEDGTFHSRKNGLYVNKWENYNHVLKKHTIKIYNCVCYV